MEEEKRSEESKPIEEKPAFIKQAEEAAARLEAANKKQEELLARQEKLMAQQILGGRSEAGQAPAAKKELTDAEYAKEVMEGRINPLK